MKKVQKHKQVKRQRRARRSRAKTGGTDTRPRLSVFRSLKHISGQIIGSGGKVIESASDTNLAKSSKLTGVARASAVGTLLAEKAKKKNVSAVVFDKGQYAYHGRVKAFADGARKGGLQF